MKTYEIDLHNLDAVSDAIREDLLRERATPKEIARTLLLVEEITIKFRMCMPGAQVRAQVARHWRTLSVRLFAEGDDRNPIAETEDWSAGTEDYYRTLILRANKALLNYQHTDGKNIVTILVRASEKKYALYSVIGMLSGIVLGAILHWLVPSSVSQWIDWNIFTVFQSIYLNAIALMAVPAVFCSVVNSITSLSSLSDTGRMGGRIMTLYTFTTLAAIAVGFALSIPAFQHGVLHLQDLGSTGLSEIVSPSFRAKFLDLVPENLIAPMMDGDILQVLLIAAITGAAIGMLGNKVEPLRVLIAACDSLFQMIIAIVALLVPFLTFVSMASLILRYGVMTFPTVFLLGAVELVGCGIMFLLYALLVRTVGGVSARPFFRKVWKFFSHTNPQASSGEYLPKVVGLCTNQLGVSERVASFSAALGSAVNMDGSAIHLVVCGVLMVRLFGGVLTIQIIILIAFVAFVLSAGASAVQNSGMVSVSSLATTLGIPRSGIGLLFGVDQILDLTRTASNAIGDVAVCVIIAHQENELDLTAYADD